MNLINNIIDELAFKSLSLAVHSIINIPHKCVLIHKIPSTQFFSFTFKKVSQC